MTALDALRAERRFYEAAQTEAMAEVDRLEETYRRLRAAGADIQELIPARMHWGLAQTHLLNVRNAWYGVQDRLTAASLVEQLRDDKAAV